MTETDTASMLDRALAALRLQPLRNALGEAARVVVDARGNLYAATAGRLVVAPGQTISSAWGNTTHDQTVICFASAADRDAQWPAPHDGSMCFVTGVGWQRYHTSWVTFGDINTGSGAPPINMGGARLINGGQIVVTTASGGSFTIPHQLGVVPTWATFLCADRASAGASWWAAAHQPNWTASVIEAAAFSPTGATIASKNIRVAWSAGVG